MREWHASWIGPAYDPREDLGLFWFQTDFELPESFDRIVVRVSADQQYRLIVNNILVDDGPDRGDECHWYFRELDLTPFLSAGENSIRAEVWNFGWMAPMAQRSVRTGFILEADDPFQFLSTPGNWKVAKCDFHRFEMMSDGIGDFYIDVGPGEVWDQTALQEFEKSPPWKSPNSISKAESFGQPGGGTKWALVPSFRTHDGWESVLLSRSRNSPIQAEISPRAPYLIDFGQLFVGYPEIQFKNSSDSPVRVTLTYAESLTRPIESSSNRITGYQDVIVLAPNSTWDFDSLWFRTFRYVGIQSEAPISFSVRAAKTIVSSLKPSAVLTTSEPSVRPIWDICLRTLKLCAIDTYFDCPYYEQLQYIGDTRLQALIGYYLSRDRHLQRKAIEQFHWSILENGLTQSRYPSRQMQVIPPFSLWWVVMLYDAWMHDPEFDPTPYLHSAEGVLKAYQCILDGDLEPFWCFGDWVPGWKWGIPPGGPHAEMHLVLLEIAKWALAQLKGSDFQLSRPARPADQPVTEHGEALWRYGQVISGQDPDAWNEPTLEGAARCTYFWQYVKHFGLQPQDYMSLMGPWREMLELGLTTTPENPEPTRSDCHGWSAHPPLGFLQLVAGVTSIAPGWSRARIQPRPGSIESFNALIPHPAGDLSVTLDNGGLRIICPVPFELVWQDQSGEYPAGEYQFRAPNE